jgi:hypothetical protein
VLLATLFFNIVLSLGLLTLSLHSYHYLPNLINPPDSGRIDFNSITCNPTTTGFSAVFEFKVILATLVRSLEFHDTKAVVLQRISPTLQPVVDGKAGYLPIHVTLAGGG